MLSSNQMILSTEEISQTLSMKSTLEVKILNDSKEFASVPAITNGVCAEVHYEGKLSDGSVIDSSLESEEPICFLVGAGRVIKGWDRAILQLKKGQKAQVICPPELAYGERG